MVEVPEASSLFTEKLKARARFLDFYIKVLENRLGR